MARKKKDSDFTVSAFRVVQEVTEETEPKPLDPELELIDGKNPHAVALSRMGGLKGGKLGQRS